MYASVSKTLDVPAEVTDNEGSLAVPAVGKLCHVLHITGDAGQ